MACVKVEFISCRNCFVRLPRSISNNLQDETVFKVNDISDSPLSLKFLSWNGQFSSNANLQIDSNFASANGLSDGQMVMLETLRSGVVTFRNCTNCTIEPLTSDDHELILAHFEEIEYGVLQLIKCINIGLIVPIWLGDSNVHLKVKILTIQPSNQDNPVILTGRTEMHLSNPDTRPLAHANHLENQDLSSQSDVPSRAPQNDSLFSSVVSMVKTYLHNAPEDRPMTQKAQISEPISDEVHSLSMAKYKLPQSTFRVVECPHIELDRSLYCSIIVNPNDIELESDANSGVLIVKMIKILPPGSTVLSSPTKPSQEDTDTDSPYYADKHFRASTVIIRLDSSVIRGYCQVPQSIRRYMGLSIASKVILKCTKLNRIIPAFKLNITPIGPSNLFAYIKINIRDELHKFCINATQDKHLILSKATLITISDVDMLLDSPTECSRNSLIYLYPEDIMSVIEVCVRDPMIKRFQTNYGLQLPCKNIRDLDVTHGFTASGPPKSALSKHLERLEAMVRGDLEQKTKIHPGSIVISGSKGSGKTHLVQQLAGRLRAFDLRAFVTFTDARTLRGKRVESIKKLLTRILSDAFHYHPSVIVIENIDSVAHSDNFKHDAEPTPELLYYQRILYLLIDFISNIERYASRVVLIVTCNDRSDLIEPLVDAKGRHYFTRHIELTLPNLDERVDILTEMLHNRRIETEIGHSGIADIAKKCDRFAPVDLKIITDRAINRACARSLGFDLTGLRLCDFVESIDGYKPLAMRGVELQDKSELSFASVGGLHEAKDTVSSTILWPIKFSTLFERCPVRPQTSILLYGPPGCGKTILGEAVAREVDINLICVKGPELLSKYIGASEEAVRDLFRRAEAARPCVVFFDEFESLAPRRGHDSTGVTDRIVNQLLTQLDGVEQRSRDVFIVAATSRPDLIDPALLRPGRFDNHIYCPLPNEADRLEILQIMTRKIQLSDDVDLSHWAHRSENFTGADLQSLCYSAQLEALHSMIDDNSEDNTDSKRSKVIIVNSRHFEQAFESTTASVQSSLSIQYPKKIPSAPAMVSARATLA